MSRRLPSIVLLLLLAPGSAFAQQPAGQETMSGDRHEVTNNQKNHHFIGSFEYQSPDGTTSIYADEAWYYSDEDRFVATGNVTFSQGNNRISAERAEFNLRTRLGTFTNASGIATVRPQRQQARAGAIAPPPVVGQQTVVYFFGDTVEKIGPKKYKITNGGFTTCVQPTPRWDLHANTVILNVDHYTVLKQAVFNVKGVPLLYVPVLIYPTKQGDRATGFLIPTYGSSSLRGQSIHNAFFWAVNRSQDATVLYDRFSKTGQGVGGEYRYNYGGGTDGNLNGYFLNQHDHTFVQSNGTAQTLPGSRTYEIRGGANQVLPGNIRARANVNYFSSIVSSQTFNTNIYEASRNQRSYGANLVGAWSGYTMNATLDRQESFFNLTDSTVSGNGPRIGISRNERPLVGSAVYFSLATEYANLIRTSKSAGANGVPTELDSGVNRIDVWPQIRYPFKKWQWFTVNSVVSWRDTFYTRSYAPSPDPRVTSTNIAAASLNRRYFSLQSQIVGPVFNRIWDTPDNGYAEKFKHSIEPFFTVQRTSAVDNFRQIIQTDAVDTITGGTNLSYGVYNRFYAKRKLVPGQPAQSREIVDVELSQSYYTNQLQAQYDLQFQSATIGGGAPSHFSPAVLSVRALPTDEFNATMRVEFDSRHRSLRTISVSSTYAWSRRVQNTVSWTKTGFIPGLPGFNDRANLPHFLNTSTNVHTRDNRFGGTYQFNYDITHSAILQQQISGFYNAQCCGLAFQYQTFNFGAGSSLPIRSDRRFFLSFTLAGLGNFSPFNGALSGVPR